MFGSISIYDNEVNFVCKMTSKLSSTRQTSPDFMHESRLTSPCKITFRKTSVTRKFLSGMQEIIFLLNYTSMSSQKYKTLICYTEPAQKCDSSTGYHLLPIDSHMRYICLKLYTSPKTWPNAEVICHHDDHHDGHLVVADDAPKEKVLAQFLHQMNGKSCLNYLRGFGYGVAEHLRQRKEKHCLNFMSLFQSIRDNNFVCLQASIF